SGERLRAGRSGGPVGPTRSGSRGHGDVALFAALLVHPRRVHPNPRPIRGGDFRAHGATELIPVQRHSEQYWVDQRTHLPPARGRFPPDPPPPPAGWAPEPVPGPSFADGVERISG